VTTAADTTLGDLAVGAAEGTRTTARWIASALGAIPSLAVLGALVRAPGEAGFRAGLLIPGVFLAAAGALIGVLGFARVLAPLALESKDLADVDLKRVAGQPFETAAELQTELGRTRAGARGVEAELVTATAKAQETERVRVAAEANVTDAEAAAGSGTPPDPASAQALRAARTELAARRREAASSAARLGSLQYDLTVWTEQSRRAEQILREAYLLRAADEVRRRFELAQLLACLSVLLVAGGVLLLAGAPAPKEKTAAPVLLELTLNDAGRAALGCPQLPRINAVRIGGTDAAPTVVTVPAPGCPSRTLTFPAASPTPLGSVSVVPTSKAP